MDADNNDVLFPSIHPSTVHLYPLTWNTSTAQRGYYDEIVCSQSSESQTPHIIYSRYERSWLRIQIPRYAMQIDIDGTTWYFHLLFLHINNNNNKKQQLNLPLKCEISVFFQYVGGYVWQFGLDVAVCLSASSVDDGK